MKPAAISAMRRLWRHRGAGAAIEFAILVPVFVALLLGILEGGRMMWVRNSIQSATEQAARYVMANTTATDSQITAVATSYYDGVGSDPATFVVLRDAVNGMSYVTVQGSYTFSYLFSIFDFGDLLLTGKSRVPLVS